MLTENSLREAMKEARAFINAGEAVFAKQKENEQRNAGREKWQIPNVWSGSPETATVRRRSMDLTRSLSRMRKP